jgi:hypothetical protein
MGRVPPPPPPNIFVIKPLVTFLLLLTPATLPFLARSPSSLERGSSSCNGEVSQGVGCGSARPSRGRGGVEHQDDGRRSRRPSHPSTDSAAARPQRSAASRRRQQHSRVRQHARRQQHPCVRWLAWRRQHRQHAPLRLPRPWLGGCTVLLFGPSSNFVKLRHCSVGECGNLGAWPVSFPRATVLESFVHVSVREARRSHLLLG